MRFRTLVAAAFALILSLQVAHAAEPRIVATIDVATQTMTVVVDNQHLYTWTVSTARPGKVTPRGSFSPFWLHANHFSSLYNNAPMPWSVFFNGNIAVHGTDQEAALGSPASAGCVRLAIANAEIFYRLVETYGMQATRIIVQ